MKSKLTYGLILFIALSLVTSTTVFARSNTNDALPSVPKGTQAIPTPNLNVPTLPEPLPNVPGMGNKTNSPIPDSTLKTLKTIENLQNIQTTLDTIKTIESLEKFQNVGTIEVILTNSKSYAKLTVSITSLLIEADLDTNIALLEKNVEMIKDTIKAELSTLTDKELGWEQESRNVLKSVRKKINAIAGKDFIADLFYSNFKLTKK